MEKELYNKLISSIPEKFRNDIIQEIEFNHSNIGGIILDDFIISCRSVLDNKKLHLRKVIHNLTKESIDDRMKDIKELEDYIEEIAQ